MEVRTLLYYKLYCRLSIVTQRLSRGGCDSEVRLLAFGSDVNSNHKHKLIKDLIFTKSL